MHYNDIVNWGHRLSRILKTNIQIVSDNISNDKNYYVNYKTFLEKYKVPKHYLKIELPKDAEFKKFQNQNQQKEYYNMWLKKSI